MKGFRRGVLLTPTDLPTAAWKTKECSGFLQMTKARPRQHTSPACPRLQLARVFCTAHACTARQLQLARAFCVARAHRNAVRGKDAHLSTSDFRWQSCFLFLVSGCDRNADVGEIAGTWYTFAFVLRSCPAARCPTDIMYLRRTKNARTSRRATDARMKNARMSRRAGGMQGRLRTPVFTCPTGRVRRVCMWWRCAHACARASTCM